MSLSELPLDEQAAYWFLRLRDEDVSPEEIEAALVWQDQSDLHRAAFARVENMWRVTDNMPSPPLPNARELARRDHSVTLTWRWALAASVLLVVAGAMAIALRLEPSAQPVRYATAVGENRVIALEDGSEVTLGGASAISVNYTRETREITLSDGEALFRVAKNRAQPFIVLSAGGQTRAVGTMFNVHRGSEAVTVSVVEGVVRVRPDSSSAQLAQLGAGHQVSYSAAGAIGAISRVSVDQIIAWRQGKWIFVDRSLADIVADLNRYSARSIIIDSDAIKSLRFTGVVMMNNMEEWLRALEKTQPVKLNASDDRLVLVATGEAGS